MKSVGSAVPFTFNYNRLHPPLSRPPPARAATAPNHSPSPLRPSSIVIPFSCREKMPGVPKASHTDPRTNPNEMVQVLLPPPPPFKSKKSTQPSNNKKKKVQPKVLDPFSAALVECAGDWPAAAAGRRAEGKVGRLGVGMHGSCMQSCSVVEPIVCANRSGFPRVTSAKRIEL